MKKIIELENRWRSYKYRALAFRIFIVVFAVFVGFVGLFVKHQYDKYAAKSAKIAAKTKGANLANPVNPLESSAANLVQNPQNQADSQVDSATAPQNPQDSQDSPNLAANPANPTSANPATANLANPTAANPAAQPAKSVSYTCRRVISEKLNVRNEASFKAKVIGYYGNGAIFCADKDVLNGLLKTNNGWVAANDTLSESIEVNTFVDSGFIKYEPRPAQRVAFEEERLLGEPTRYPSARANQTPPPRENRGNRENAAANLAANPRESATAPRPKPIINISSEKITKEKEIETKQMSFKQTNNYDTAIDIAHYYYDNKDFDNAIKWALSASNAESKNKSKAESWIIYAKSLYSLGKKDEAIEVLNRYIANTSSKDAAAALDNMKRGAI